MKNTFDLSSLRHAVDAGHALDYLFFWGHRLGAGKSIDKACLSQWFPAPFHVEGVRFATAEHFMMARKAELFGDTAMVEKILAAPTPDAAKSFGRKVKNFDAGVWDMQREQIVFEGSLAKFAQNEAMKAFLLSTGERVLVEASPVDAIWGIGLAATDPRAASPHAWAGLNLLGFALMKAREALRPAHGRGG